MPGLSKNRGEVNSRYNNNIIRLIVLVAEATGTPVLSRCYARLNIFEEKRYVENFESKFPD